MSSLRERKRVRTRQALIDAAADLFERRGYDRTTIADIAAAADISTRTFFAYFASKEDVVFPDADARVTAALAAVGNRRPGERPTHILLGASDLACEIGHEWRHRCESRTYCGTRVRWWRPSPRRPRSPGCSPNSPCTTSARWSWCRPTGWWASSRSATSCANCTNWAPTS